MKTIEFGKLEAVKFCTSSFQKPGQKAVHLRQEVTTVYSGGAPGEVSLLPEKAKRYPSMRHIVVPCSENETLETIKQKLGGKKIGRIIASEPIVLPKHEWALANTDLQLETIAERQLIPQMDAESNAVLDADGNKVPMLDNFGWPQYKVHRLVELATEDVDTRFNVPVPVAEAVTADAEDDTQQFDA